MIRIHLAQIYYNLAYYSHDCNLLEEPHFSPPNSEARLGRLRKYPDVKDLLESLGQSYLEYLSSRLTAIIKWSINRHANVIVFPEYSVPAVLLPQIVALCKDNNLHVIAGSHRVLLDAAPLDAYESLGINSRTLTPGAAYVPVIAPSGSVTFVPKLTRSRWDSDLIIPEAATRRVVTLDNDEDSVASAVLPCIDALRLDSLGQEFNASEEFPRLVLCPSYSPSTDSFTEIGTVLARHEAVLATVNSAEYGNSSFFVPETLKRLFEQPAAAGYSIAKGDEAILELDYYSVPLHSSRGTVCPHQCGKSPRIYPIIYQDDANWLEEFNLVRSLVLQSLDEGSSNSLREDLVSGLLVDYGTVLSPLVKAQLFKLAQNILPLFDGNKEIIEDMFRLVSLSDITAPMFFAAERTGIALDALTEFYKGDNCPGEENLHPYLDNLKQIRTNLPKVKNRNIIGSESLHKQRPDTFTAEQDLLGAFQNRGSDLDRFREFFRNPNTGIMFLSGPSGIGKSDLCNAFLRKSLLDWTPIIICVAEGGGMPKLMVSVAHSLGLSFDIDAIASVSTNVFKERALKIARALAAHSKFVLILDEVTTILTTRSGRDRQMLSLFLDALCKEGITPTSKIIIVSSVRFPNSLINRPKSASHRLYLLDRKYIERIIERDIRKNPGINDIPASSVLARLANLAHGHPLVARIIADVASRKSVDATDLDEGLNAVASVVAGRLLSQVVLDEEERLVLELMSVFRVPVSHDILFHIPEFSKHEKAIKSLSERIFLSYDGTSLDQHEVVRIYYRKLAKQNEQLEDGHKLAASYFERLIQINGREGSVLECAELAHHLASYGEYEKAMELRSFVLEEIKPIAKKKYRAKAYVGALDLFNILNDVSPKDPTLLAYIGRCYGRLSNWPECNLQFEAAVQAARLKGQSYWWIYRDWGQLLARYNYINDAEDKLAEAEKSYAGQNNASIKATRAFMAWKSGDLVKATELFEEALALDKFHRYTLCYYERLLRETGNVFRADELVKDLEEIEDNWDQGHTEDDWQQNSIEEYDLDLWDD